MNRLLVHVRVLGTLALAAWLGAPFTAGAQLRIAGNTSTIELAPVLLAAEELGAQRVAVKNGGIPALFDADAADLATNAETQALRQSVDHPDLRIIFTVAEGFYRVVARRSAGVRSARGPARQTDRDRAEHLVGVLLITDARDGRSRACRRNDRAAVSAFADARRARGARNARSRSGARDQRAADLVGTDSIEFQDRRVYRDCLNLHACSREPRGS
jgi:NitT/TauT family transport system substrate-binding protein